MINKLREPKIHLTEGVDVAIFDVGGTVLGGYVVAKIMNWNVPATILGTFMVGHLAHNSSGVETPLSTKINETFTGVQENPDKIVINNSTTPVQTNEVRFSTF